MMKDWLLDGVTPNQIAQKLTDIGAPPPKGDVWYPQSVRLILKNEFYAGKVVWGRTKTHLDPRTGTTKRVDNPSPVIAEGMHQPLWDESVHLEILDELEHRSTVHPGRRTLQLTSLLYCKKCTSSVQMNLNGPRSEPQRRIYRCIKGCTNVPYTQALEWVGAGIKTALKRFSGATGDNIYNTGENSLESLLERHSRILDKKVKIKNRILEGYEAGLYSPQEAKKRMDKNNAEMERIHKKINNLKNAHLHAQKRKDALLDTAAILEHTPEWLLNEKPEKVNKVLRLFVDKFVISDDSLEVVLK
jgi:hypothetical protein